MRSLDNCLNYDSFDCLNYYFFDFCDSHDCLNYDSFDFCDSHDLQITLITKIISIT